MDEVDLTVIICCYNSSTRIKSTLEHLAKQELFGLKAELILVDNNCSDETVIISEKVWTKCNRPFPFINLNEPNPGLSFARKTGLLAAKGDIVIFCDDDNWLDKDYLLNAFQIMNRDRNIGVLAGQSNAVSDIEIPNWFYTYYGLYACGVIALESGDVTSRRWVWGAGMVVRKNVMLEMYSRFRHITTDRKGTDFSSGGDVEICLWHVLSLKQFDAQLQSCKKLSRLDNLANEYLLWKDSSKKYLFGIIVKLVKLNFYDFAIKLCTLLVLLRIWPNKWILSAYKIKSLFRFHNDEIR